MSGDIRVVNLGTAEKPNFAGSAYEMGRFRGIHDVLVALKALNLRDEYAYDDCLDAVKAMLPKGVEW